MRPPPSSIVPASRAHWDPFHQPPYKPGTLPLLPLESFYPAETAQWPIWAGGKAYPFLVPPYLLSPRQAAGTRYIPESALGPPGRSSNWGNAYMPPGWGPGRKTWQPAPGWHGSWGGTGSSQYPGSLDPNWDPRWNRPPPMRA